MLILKMKTKTTKTKNRNNTEGSKEKADTSSPLPSSTPVSSLRRNHRSSGILPEMLCSYERIYSLALKNTIHGAWVAQSLRI